MVKAVDLVNRHSVTFGNDGNKYVIGIPRVCLRRPVTVDKGVITFTCDGAFRAKLVGWLTATEIDYKLGE